MTEDDDMPRGAEKVTKSLDLLVELDEPESFVREAIAAIAVSSSDRWNPVLGALRDLAAELAEANEPAPKPAERLRTYIVKPGDTLWAIAEKEYGDGAKYHRIFEANSPPLTDPDKIHPGVVLKIPLG